ncbi:MAG: hypothetical protein CME43_11895 [Haliea sp.]|uniref:DUF2164 domain-containing protein n=1 Tax=Haliea sp. TaxID=1932666 RepID=UPI000C484D44|nr:DUF2164 domain-containing protein [Haliea sp.]MBM70169.1 hypothetical protein [Haliea sp.]|tara:strand:- start:60675 stop:60920 length:246 start_codon:yes stop_codon:yes gene_type:complete
MKPLDFSREQKERMAAKVKRYLNEELQQDIGSFDAEFLVDFLAEELGPYFYNRGLSDAMSLFTEKMGELDYQVQELAQAED